MDRFASVPAFVLLLLCTRAWANVNETQNDVTLKMLLDARVQASSARKLYRQLCKKKINNLWRGDRQTADEWCDCLAMQMSSKGGDGRDKFNKSAFRNCCMSFKEEDKTVLWRTDYRRCCDSFDGSGYNIDACGYTQLGPIVRNKGAEALVCTGFRTEDLDSPPFCSDGFFDTFEHLASYEKEPKVICNYYDDGAHASFCRAAVGKNRWQVCANFFSAVDYVSVAGKPIAPMIDAQASCCSIAFPGREVECCENTGAVWGWGTPDRDPDDEAFANFFARICGTDGRGQKAFKPLPLLSDVQDICLFSLNVDLGLSGSQWFEFCGCLQSRVEEDRPSRARLFTRGKVSGNASASKAFGRDRYFLNLQTKWADACCTEGANCCRLQRSQLFNPRKQRWRSCKV